MTITVEMEGVTRRYGKVTALRDFDLRLHAGRIYGLLGPNGAGKSTTLRTVLGFSQPDEGRVRLFGAPPDDHGRARVGYVPEQRALPDHGRVRDLLVFYARIRGYDPGHAAALADAWIDRLELGEQAHSAIPTLSNGQQQKVQVALALMIEPELVLLDEPLTGLDPRHQEVVFRAVREVAAAGATVLMSTHRLREAQALLDHVVLVARGEKKLDAPLHQALADAFDGTWRVRARGDVAWIHGPDVTSVTPSGPDHLVRLAPGASAAGLLARAAEARADVLALEALLPSLHDLYLLRVGALPDAQEPA